ncbi:hypothetical protein [Pseudomonas izuensis]|uniref:hypothetical protein n=1 Tax=Pseudomonas izuensis TaxID=2684212 RepID=UPI00135CBFB1|nr:hypothetical protein [Pseudomonas izuensis]
MSFASYVFDEIPVGARLARDGVSSVAKGVPHESISGSFARFSGGVTLDLPKIPVA